MTNNKYKVFDKFILRTHIFPLNKLNIFSKTHIDDDELRIIARNKVFLEALYISSPIMYNKILKWLDNNISNKKEIEKLYYSLVKYYIRMSSRCTPYGLMASCTVGSVATETKLELKPYREWRKKTNLDMDYLFLLIKFIEKDPSILKKLRFFLNSSLYFLNDKIRMVEYQLDENKERKYKIVSYESTDVLLKIIKKVENGSNIEELAKEIIDDDISLEDAILFIEDLIFNQILVSELEPTISGVDCLSGLNQKLININHQTNKYINKLKSCLNEIDNTKLGESINMYHKILKLVDINNINFEVKYLFNTNLFSTTKKCSISQTITQKLIQTIQIIECIDNYLPNNNLERFKNEFHERFGDREIPLSLVMDAESGIGYGKSINKISNDTILKGKELINKDANNTTFILSPFLEFILNRYSHALYNGQRVIELQELEIKKLFKVSDSIKYPPTFMTCASIYPSENQDSEIIQLHWFGGSGSKLIARFGQSDKNINNLIEEVSKFEEEYYEDKIVAEIIHLPDDRLGNILIRPKTYSYEIPYLANSSLPKSNQLNINDLIVFLKGNKIILKSKTLNKEVIPCFSSAQNYMLSSLPIYRFLCDLQHQDLKKGYVFSWDILEDIFIFLPRVTLNGIVLFPSTWNIYVKDIEHLFGIKNDLELIDQVNIWRESIKLPEQVKFVESDNELIIFFNNVLCIKMFFSLIKNKGKVKFKELLFSLKDESLINNEDGSYNNEILLAFQRV